jgi:alanyl-tRNA synthetase
VEALTGTATLERLRANEARLAHAAGLLKATPEELGAAIERRLLELREVQDQLKATRQAGAAGEAADLASKAVDGIVVARRDGLDTDGLRELALAVLARPGARAVLLGGSPEAGKVALVAAAQKGFVVPAPELVSGAARLVGGGGGGRNPELAMAGGRDVSRLDEALETVRARLLGTGPVAGGS